MPIINPDTSAMLDMGPIEPGTYLGEISQIEYKTSKSGNPMLEISWDVEVNGKKRSRKSYNVISGEGSGGFDQLLRAAGFTELADKYKDPAVQPKPAFDTDQLLGQKVNVVIEPNLYNGEMRDQIRSFLKR